MSKELTVPKQSASLFSGASNFTEAMEMATVLSKSDMVPKNYIGKPGNCLIAIDIAIRHGVSPFVIMQEMEPINGNPTFSSKYLIATVESSGKFSNMEWEFQDSEGKTVNYLETVWQGGNKSQIKRTVDIPSNLRCRVKATRLSSGKELEGPWVSIEMAIQEGWYYRKGSKWQTMPKVMLRYRAASIWTSFFAPNARLGMKTKEEVLDQLEPTVIDTDHEDITAKPSPLADLNKEVEEPSTKAAEAVQNKEVEEIEVVQEAESSTENANTDKEEPPLI